MKKLLRKLRRAITKHEPGYHDMYLNEGERFFARLYLHYIRKTVREQNGKQLKLLDAGCQTGRLAIPLAGDGHRVTGLDTSALAIHKAGEHARRAGVTLELVKADMGKWLPKQPEGSFDAVLCNEVLYLRSNWRELQKGLIRLLRPGGLCFVSHRPPAFYDKVISGEGPINGSYYNWQTREELENLYRDSGIRVLRVSPIWQISRLVNPEKVTEEQREALFLEETSAAERSNNSRYLLVCGKKR